MTLVRDVTILVSAALRNDAPAIAAARGKRHPNHVIAGRQEVFHLLVALISDISIEEYNSHESMGGG
jgi:hypothetical protein